MAVKRSAVPTMLLVLFLIIGQQLLPVLTTNLTTEESITSNHQENVDKHHDNNSDGHGGESEAHAGHEGVHVAAWNFDYVELPLVVTAFALLVGIAKVGRYLKLETFCSDGWRQ